MQERQALTTEAVGHTMLGCTSPSGKICGEKGHQVCSMTTNCSSQDALQQSGPPCRSRDRPAAVWAPPAAVYPSPPCSSLALPLQQSGPPPAAVWPPLQQSGPPWQQSGPPAAVRTILQESGAPLQPSGSPRSRGNQRPVQAKQAAPGVV